MTSSLATKYERLTCPVCGRVSLRNIETCGGSEEEVKTAWTCSCSEIVVYIVEFKRDGTNRTNE